MIGRLLEISSTPISLEMKVTPAKLEVSSEKPSYDMSRTQGGLSISHQYPQMSMDSTETWASMELKTPLRAVLDTRQEIQRDFQRSIENIVDLGGRMMTDTTGTNLLGEYGMQNNAKSSDTQMVFFPSVPANIDWQPPQLDMRYEMDRISFDWRTSRPEMEFTPAQIEIMVKEYPKLNIQYIGKPLYVPPSADPDYVPPELDVTA